MSYHKRWIRGRRLVRNEWKSSVVGVAAFLGPSRGVSAMNRTRRRDLKHVALTIAVEGSVPENLSRLMLVSFN
jgi:hypothetical protein